MVPDSIMRNLPFMTYVRLFCGHGFMHNCHFPPDFEVECDHKGVVIDYLGRTLSAGWYSALEGTRGGRCHIVLSGPSVAEVARPERLAECYSIWVNNSPKLALSAGVRPSLYLVADPDFIERQFASFHQFSELSDASMISFAGAARLLERGAPVPRPVYLFDDSRYPFRRRRGLGMEIHGANTVKGCHTVATTAVRAAMRMGFSEIYIFGLDLGGSKRFYAEQSPEPSRLDAWFGEISAEFRNLAREASARGVKLVNCSPVTCLPADIMEIRNPEAVL